MKQEVMQAIEADHLRAMEYVDRAQASRQRGDTGATAQNFIEAFLLEKQAAEAIVPYLDIEPTRSILLRSAASLALECERQDEAERLACMALSGTPPEEIRTQLREVLLAMWKPASR